MHCRSISTQAKTGNNGLDQFRNLHLAVAVQRLATPRNKARTVYIVSFYRFTKIDELGRTRKCVETLCSDSKVQGTVVLATEGINAALAHSDAQTLITIVDQIQEILVVDELRPTFSRAHLETRPFDKLRVRVRSEIVSYGTMFDFKLPDLPRSRHTQWTSFLLDNDTVVLDVRNQYEHNLGRFRNSVQPQTSNFREFKDFITRQTEIDKEQTVAIYCTGGIRCEKAAQSMYAHGFTSVVQLDRGVLGYFEETKDDSLWEGECFVFDQRVAVNGALTEGTTKLCLACGGPITPYDRTHSKYEHGISCPACHHEVTPVTRARRAQRLRQLHLARVRAARQPNQFEFALSGCSN